jgi:hypothetical protein
LRESELLASVRMVSLARWDRARPASRSFASYLEAAHRDRGGRHEPVTREGLAGLDAVDGEFHDIGPSVSSPKVAMIIAAATRRHPDLASALAHDFSPESADDHQQDVREQSIVARPGFSISAM